MPFRKVRQIVKRLPWLFIQTRSYFTLISYWLGKFLKQNNTVSLDPRN